MEGRLPGARADWSPTGGWKPPLLQPRSGFVQLGELCGAAAATRLGLNKPGSDLRSCAAPYALCIGAGGVAATVGRRAWRNPAALFRSSATETERQSGSQEQPDDRGITFLVTSTWLRLARPGERTQGEGGNSWLGPFIVRRRAGCEESCPRRPA